MARAGSLLRGRKGLLLAVILAVAAGIAFWAMAGHRDVMAGEEVLVTRTDLILEQTLAGRVDSPGSGQGIVRVPRGAAVSRVFVRPGDKVWRGDPVVRIYAGGYDGYLALAQAELRDAEKAHAIAKSQVDGYLSKLKKDLAAARAVEKQARVAKSPTALFEATQRRERMQLEMRSATAGRVRFLAPYQDRVARATERCKDAEWGLPTDVVKAPSDGIVQEVRVKKGDRVKDGNAIVRIVDPWALALVADLTPAQALQVRAGMPAEVTLDGRDAFLVKVASVEVDMAYRVLHGRTRYVAVLDLSESPIRLALGQKAEITVTVARRPDTLAVTGACIRTEGGKSVATVMRGGRWQTVPVEVGLDDGHHVEIRSGLKESETVLIPR